MAWNVTRTTSFDFNDENDMRRFRESHETSYTLTWYYNGIMCVRGDSGLGYSY